MSSRLQRSSVSFRRQGTSGRIWNDPLHAKDLKGAESVAPDPMGLSAGPGPVPGGLPDLGAAAASPSSRRPRPRPLKRQRHGLSSFFCSCVRPPPTTSPPASGHHDL